MNEKFFKDRIEKLSNEKLVELLGLRRQGNEKVQSIARAEAARRNLSIDAPDSDASADADSEVQDMRLLKRSNWAAVLLGPVWTTANKLDKWTVFYFVPPISIGVAIYLGLEGNRMAFEKSNIRSVEEFMIVQRKWSLWTIKAFLVSIGLSVLLAYLSSL
jgi:hypothetical protein